MALRERVDSGDGIGEELTPPTRLPGERRRGIDRPARNDLARANAELQRENERLERANAELWRENERLARGTLGQSDAAAAAQLLRAERDLRPQLGEAEARIERLERLLATPRHRAVEELRDRVMRVGLLYRVVSRTWRLVAGSRLR